MRTVGWLRETLAAFPDDCELHAYEGEDTGLTVYVPRAEGERYSDQFAFIPCRDGSFTERHGEGRIDVGWADEVPVIGDDGKCVMPPLGSRHIDRKRARENG